MMITRDPRLIRITKIIGIVAVIWLFTVFQLLQKHPTRQLADLAAPSDSATSNSSILNSATSTSTSNPETSHSAPSNPALSNLASPTSVLSTSASSTPEPSNTAALEDIKQSTPQLEQSKIAKICMLYYDNVTDDSIAYEKAIASHKAHDERFHYQSYLLRRGILPGYYAKPAYILSILVQELVKAPEERLEWLVWYDADLVLMNSEIPLEAFVPPPQFSHIHLIVTNDLGGLNNGVFFIRVHAWSVSLLIASMAYKTFNPEFSSVSEDQAALDKIIQRDDWKGNVTHVPQRWFNSYHDFGIDDDIPPEWNWYHHYFKPGYLLVHFPGTGQHRTNLINEYTTAKANDPQLYEVPFLKTNLTEEIAKFWAEDAPREQETQETFWYRHRLLQRVGSKADGEREKACEEIKTRMAGESAEKIEAAIKAKKQEFKGRKIESLRAAEKPWPQGDIENR
ncbi:hypothetical protein ABW20_dc0103143 [Dactylellina cionopaga]|nr:hypothetical protein ABW20_dc0103143 [Dactylellina cionopaga]